MAAPLDPAGEPRDGIRVLGGESFFQPVGLPVLLQALATRGIRTVVSSGSRQETLRHRPEPDVVAALDLIDRVMNGRSVAAVADRAGPWTRSGNQRVIDLATGHPGRCVTAPQAGGSDA